MAKDDEVVKKPDEEKPLIEAEPEEPDFKTPEDIEFEETQAEVKAAEEAAASAAPEPDPTEVEKAENAEALAKAAEPEPGAVVATPDPVKTPDAIGATDQRMVPIAALHDTRGKLQDSELARARLEGEKAALQQQVQQGQPQQPGQPAQPQQPQQSREDQITALNAQIDALWAQGDEGALSLVEIRQKERVFEAQLKTLEDPVNVQQQQPQGPPQLDATIETNLVRLEAEFPVITSLSEVAMSQFVKQAYEVANAEGNPIGEGALETMRLHNLSAKHAHDHYAKFFGAAPAAPAAVAPQTGQPQTPVPPAAPNGGLSPEAQARADKLDLQAAHPPNINNLGTTAEGQMSDDQIAAKMEGMSEDEAIEFLETMPGLAKRLGVTMSGPQ